MIKHMETNALYGLYVHIPFCVSKCSYCDFASVAKNNHLIDEYTKALCNEMKMHKAKFSHIQFDTIFIGGGTPSCIPQKNLVKIIHAIYDNFNTDIKEFTVEVNPGTGSKELFYEFKNLGVNRISVGLQCANDDILKSIGRIHNVDQFAETVNQIKSAGISDFSADIITGLPKQTPADVLKSIDFVHKLGANHISMYTLKLEDGTPIKSAVENGHISLPSQEQEYEMSRLARECLYSLGYNRYEISNYAKEGHESKHNLKYWERVPYLGVGVSSASMYDNTRYTNTRAITEYISSIYADKLPFADSSILSKEDIAFEMIMLSTRLTHGMEYKKYDAFTGENFKAKYAEVLDALLKQKLIEKSNTHLVLTQRGMDLQNQVLLMFMD